MGVANILATSFLNVLFEFSANTNLNKALLFDGIVSDKQGHYAFVEVDEGDDSLESCRRLLGERQTLMSSSGGIAIVVGVVLANWRRWK